MKRNKLFGLFVAVIMVSSIAGIAFHDFGSSDEKPTGSAISDNAIEVNGYYFYEDPTQDSFNALITSTEGEALIVPFRTDPRQVSGIEIEDAAIESVVYAQKIYLTFDPNTPNFAETKNNLQVAMAQVSRLISRVNAQGVFPTGAITADIPNETYDDQIPIKTCDDATNTTAVLFFTISDEDAVKMQGNCVVISAKSSERLIATADKFGMHLVGLRI